MVKEKGHYFDDMLRYLKVSANQFAKSIGLERTDRIYHVTRGRNGVSEDLASMITERYPEINYNWLITGEGPMLKTDIKEFVQADTITMPREVFDQINGLIETVKSQQDSIKSLANVAESITRIEKKIDDREGVVPESGGVLQIGR